MTDNIRGMTDDGNGLYLGRHLQDPAVMDRCWKLRMEYIDEESETALLESRIPDVEVHGIELPVWKKQFAQRLCAAANKVREAYFGSHDVQPIEATISTRVLLRLKDLLIISGRTKELSVKDALNWALRIALTEAVDKTSALTIQKIVEAELGNICSHLAAP